MIATVRLLLLRLKREEHGQVLPVMVILLVGFLGISALSVDLGRCFSSYRELQASTDAAALAGAQTLPSSSAVSEATTYSSQSGDLNAATNLPSVSMVSGYPKVECLTSLGVGCPGPAGGNAIQVRQQMTVPLYFSGIFGKKSVTLTATATASIGGIPKSYNVAVVVDTTLSMTAMDSDCGATQISCALSGVQVLLNGLWPCGSGYSTCIVSNGVATGSVDRVALFTFPNVSVGTASIDSTCTTAMPSSHGSTHYSYSNSYGYYSMLPSNAAWTGVTTAVPYSFPTAGASSYSPAASPTSTPTYQLTPFLSDYSVSDTATTLNSSSALSKAVGAGNSCGGMTTSNYDGNYGTYFAGAVYAAQSSLTAAQAANPGSQNAIILLGDGNADAPQVDSQGITVMPSPATSNGLYPSWKNECGQAVTAAQYATNRGTLVFTVAYGSSTSGCTTDSDGYNPCSTLAAMASTPQNFYSDYTATGSDGTCVSTYQPTSNLKQIFQLILGKLTKAKLIPNNTV
jgi:Flp pilus assembly protein TadG